MPRIFMQSRITCPIWLGRSKSSALDLPLAGGDVGAAVLGSILSVILVFDGVACALFDGSIGADRLPDATERAAVLAAVKDAARR